MPQAKLWGDNNRYKKLIALKISSFIDLNNAAGITLGRYIVGITARNYVVQLHYCVAMFDT